MADIKKLKLLVFDVDGTLTPATIAIGNDGELAKSFSVRDGLAMALAPYAGLKIALLTGRSSKITQHRGEELKVAFCRQGVQNKVAELSKIIEEEGWSWEEIGYMGDDLNDLGVLARVGFAAAPADAALEVQDCADWIAGRNGGDGAAREWIEMVLQAQGRWDELVQYYKNQSSEESV